MPSFTNRITGSFVMGLCLCAFMMLAYATQIQKISYVDNLIYDAFLEFRADGESSSAVLFIDIDDESLAEFGQWPWPRDVIASLVTKLADYGVAAIGLDILFVEPDRSSPSISEKDDQTGAQVHVQGKVQNNDHIFAEALANTPTVLAMFVNTDAQLAPLSPDLLLRERVFLLSTDSSADAAFSFIPSGAGALLPLPQFRTVAPMGNVNSYVDDDAVVRSIPLLISSHGHIFISFALRTFMRAHNVSDVRLYGDADGLRSVQVADLVIPVQADGRILVPFRGGSGLHKSISAADILKNTVNQHEIHGRICIIGTSATGLHDNVATPLSPIYPGAEVHLTLIDAFVNGEFIEIPSMTIALQLLCMAVVGIVCIIFFQRLTGLVRLCTILLLLLTPLCVSWGLFQAGIFFSPFFTMMLVGVLALCIKQGIIRNQ